MEVEAAQGRVDFRLFLEEWARQEGFADAYVEALKIIGEAEITRKDILHAVIDLAREGTAVEIIAARCGLNEREVAEHLVRYIESLAFRGEEE